MAKEAKEVKLTRTRLIDLLNEDLEREYQAIISYVVYSQVLKGAEYMNIADELEVHAGEELQHHQPDRRVDDIPDEVHRAVALAFEQCARRRGAVDHDRARGQQAQRRRQQQVVLDRLGLALGLRRGLGTSLCSDSHCLGRSTPGPRTLAAQVDAPRLHARLDG